MSPDDLNTRHYPTVERVYSRAYAVRCACGYSWYIDGHKARDKARDRARDHVAWCCQNEAQREAALANA